MKKITVRTKAAKKLRAGYPLLVAEDLSSPISEDDFAQFFDEKAQALGTGYLSKQNKGIGWLLSTSSAKIDHHFYVEKFVQARSLRAPFFQDELTIAFRLFNGEGDGLGGLTIDFYNGFVVFSWYNPFIYSQKKAIVKAFQVVFPDIKGAYEKLRFADSQLESQYLFGEEAQEPLLVMENGVTYATYLNEGLMTGIFLDQKNVRGALVNGLVAGKTLLNMFSYTGAFSVAAAVGGASQTTSVDLAKRSLDKTREQFLVNGIEPDSQKIYVMDVFGYFNYAKKKNLTYDIVVLDPPSFARNGKKTFSVAKNYGELVEEAVDILEDNGTLIASTNAANVSDKKFRQMVEESLKNKGVKFTIFQEEKLPADFQIAESFPEGNYLKVLFIKIKK
ncbi:SAM-dependent methyltransferase [Lactococcus lactis]|uniref:class I SAM-dependent rRNA methyltransferase n=1 Tax=Lactococcus lactis subsp. cremoris TaxID=1359 RepID=UPI0007D954C2|nr:MULTISPECIES: class I SAM-dependent rRNA methyltransferase [Lactococcus]AXN64505.1 SAM-dependent methyltransferase [Lactococcus cremoris]MRM50120.1 methyltransferase [Lactococcus cremoris]OAJ98150.1 SAM-dependent methyltransferase [Lactococcus lactis]